MVQRGTERLDLGQSRTPEVAIANPGRVAPRNTAGVFDNQIATKYPDLTPVPDGRLDPIVAALFNVGQTITNTLIDRAEQDAYLNGALAVGRGLTEDQIEANPLTRRWAQAGYRDMVGRLALAQYEADIAKDMAKLREGSPDDMARYLQVKRREISPILDRMSDNARRQLFQQLLTTEQHGLATHMKAHQEFIATQHNTATATLLNSGIETLVNTGGPSDPRYRSALASLGAKLDANVWQNDNLTQEMKLKLIEEAVISTLAQGDSGLYQLVRNGQVTGENGEAVSLWAQLPFSTQAKLAKEAHSADGKHTARMHRDFWDKVTAVQVSLAQGRPVDMGVMYSLTDAGVTQGIISPEKRISLLTAAARAQGEADKTGAIVRAVNSGDQRALIELDVSQSQAAKITVREAVRDATENGTPFGAVFQSLTGTAIETGNSELLSQAGSILSDQINILMYAQDGEIDANTSTALTAWTQMVDRARESGNPSALAASLSLLPEKQQDFMLTYFAVRTESFRNPENPQEAADQERSILMQTREIMRRRETTDTSAMREVSQVKFVEDREAALLDLEATGKIGAFGKSFLGLFSEKARADLALTRQGSRWITNDAVYREQEDMVRAAIRDEYTNLARTHAGWRPQELADKAMINVANRTIRTDYGILTLPRGADIRGVFNLPPAAGPEIVGLALNRIVDGFQIPTDRDVSFVLDRGALSIRERNEEGEYVGKPHLILNSEVGRVAEDILSGEDTLYMGAYGTGKTATGNTGVKVTYNGANTVGVPNTLALEARDTLVRFENVRDKPYQDGKDANDNPRYSVGVGVNQINDAYPKESDFGPDGRLTDEAMTRSFTVASDAAMNAAVGAMHSYYFPTDDKNLFLLFTNMAYQGGTGFYRTDTGGYKQFLETLAVGTADEAVEAFKGTNVYKAAHDERREWYLARVREHFNK